MKVKMISPAKTAADSPFWRSIKYSLFPPLGLAILAGYLDENDDITLQDEHVERLDLDDDPDLVVIEAYITSANRAYSYAYHYRAISTMQVIEELIALAKEMREANARGEALGAHRTRWPMA